MKKEEIKDLLKIRRCPNCNSNDLDIIPVFGYETGILNKPNTIFEFLFCFCCGTMFNSPRIIKEYMEKLKKSKKYRKYLINN